MACVKCSFPTLGVAMSVLSWPMKTRKLKGRRTGLTNTQRAEYDMNRSSLIFISFTVLSGNTTVNILGGKRKYFCFDKGHPVVFEVQRYIKIIYMCSV